MAMSTWQDLHDYLSATFQGFTGYGELLSRFVVKHGDEAVKIGLTKLTSDAKNEWALFLIKVCEAHLVDPTHALAANFVMSIGSLAVMDGTLIVTQRLPVRGLEADHIHETIDALIKEKATVMERLVKRPGASDTHSHLAE
jgi:hypothetical protein